MTVLPNIGLVLPTRGSPGSGHWADTVDGNYQLLDAHTHKPGQGLPINSAALSIDGDVSFGSSWAITALNRVTFAAVTALAANNKSIFVSSADNELYWRSNAGSNVKLTNGNALNVAAFVGGIGGDYTAVSAAENYDDSAKRYTFKQGGGTNWAKIQAGTLRLTEFGTSETVFVEQACPAALASSYTMTWPTALPGAGGTLVQIDNTGQIAFGNTGLAATTFTGAVTLNGGVATSFALAANQSITISGTGQYKHGSKQIVVPASAAHSATMTFDSGGTGNGWLATGANQKVYFPFAIQVGKRVVSIDIWYLRNSGTLTFNFNRVTLSSTSTTTISTTTDTSTSAVTSKSLSAINHTVLNTEQYLVQCVSGAAGDVFYAAVVTYDEA